MYACGTSPKSASHPFVSVPDFALVFVTVTSYKRPAGSTGALHVIVVVFTNTTFVAAAVPNLTVAPAAKFVPVIVTAVPTAAGPDVGVMEVTVGVGGPGAPTVRAIV
jgi:hypothetical protein